MSFWTALRIGSSGMSAQRLRMDIISNNIANAETTRTAEGGPYKRQDVIFMPKAQSTFLPEFIRARQAQDIEVISEERGMKVAGVTTDDSEGLKVYDPSHPDADKDGFVTYPNVNMVVEMTNMLSATRSYEANLAVINFAKQMALRAIDIGR
ncbi:MAG: flagellar basal body rod protein FlgC [Anaerolineales bacterium]|nr:flagellar basal body rod protein FlgC [Anaerolineales bacterium]